MVPMLVCTNLHLLIVRRIYATNVSPALSLIVLCGEHPLAVRIVGDGSGAFVSGTLYSHEIQSLRIRGMTS
jgi:hypothetical protein